MFKIPVLFLAYNRPELTKKSIKRIVNLNPYKIYVSIDGPKNKKKDDIKVRKVRKIIKNIETINKKIILKTKINSKNLGCKNSNLAALNWFFKNEAEGIIVEDDCLIDKKFLNFCKIILKKYKYNKKVFCISGSNFQKNKISKESYYFSKYNHCWGWATWRNRWQKNDGSIKFWPKFKKTNAWKNLHDNIIELKYWNKIFDKVYLNKIDSWAYPWTLSVWKNQGITVTPNSNLVTNIGFGANSTHSILSDKKIKYLNKSKLKKDILHPKLIKVNNNADKYVFKKHFKGQNYIWPYRLFYLIKLIVLNPLSFLARIKKIIPNN